MTIEANDETPPRNDGRMKKWGPVVLGVAVTAAVLAGVMGVGSTRANMMGMGGSSSPGQGMASTPGTAASFAYLSMQRSNQCGLTPQGVMQMDPAGRLQGSCCSSMQMTSYAAQVKTLTQFRGESEIPSDPYDIPVSLVRQLLGYQTGIHLSITQQTVYDQAMGMTPDKAPCCCHCWRWDMTQGLANYLIARRGWSAERVAAVVALVNGCGGTWQPAATTGSST